MHDLGLTHLEAIEAKPYTSNDLYYSWSFLTKIHGGAPECQWCRPTTHLDLGRWRQGLHFSATFATEHYVIRERN